MVNNYQSWAYPSETIDPKKKNKDYISQYGRAFLSEFIMQGGDRWYNGRSQYNEYIDYANGKQSIERYKKFISDKPITGEPTKRPNIDYSILPLVPKYMNLVAGLLEQTQYEASATAIDAVAQSEKDDYEYRQRALMQHKELIAQFAPNSVDEDMASLPIDEDELQLKLGGWKHWAAMKVEMGLTRALYNSTFEQLQPELTTDAYTFGAFCTRDYLQAGEPMVKRVDPRYAVIPYSDYEDYRDIRKAGHFESMTIGDLRLLARDEFTEEEYEMIASANRGSGTWPRIDHRLGIGFPYDSQKIEVFFFEFLSYDERVFKATKDQRGNEVLRERGYMSNKKENIRKGYRCLYEGAIIPNTKFAFNCQRAYDQKRPQDNPSDCYLTYHPYSPGMRYGVPVSLVGKVKVPADMAQRAWLQLNIALTKYVPKGYSYDISVLENIVMGSAGEAAKSPAELAAIHRTTGDLFYRSIKPDGTQLNTAGGITPQENGLSKDIAEFYSILQQSTAQIEGITGINATAAGMVNPDIGKGVSELALQSANNAISYLYHARKMGFQNICKAMAIRIYDHLEHGEIKGSYEKNNGNRTKTEMVNISREEAKKIVKHRFDFTITVKPTQQDWQDFYRDVNQALINKEITLADAAYLKEVDNLKQARVLLSVRDKRNKMEAAAKEQANIEANNEGLAAAAERGEAAKQQTLQLEYQLKDQSAAAKHAQMLELQADRYANEKELEAMRGQTRIDTTTLEGRNQIEDTEARGDNELDNIEASHLLQPTLS